MVHGPKHGETVFDLMGDLTVFVHNDIDIWANIESHHFFDGECGDAVLQVTAGHNEIHKLAKGEVLFAAIGQDIDDAVVLADELRLRSSLSSKGRGLHRRR